jgi:Fe-S-cluster containining protein
MNHTCLACSGSCSGVKVRLFPEEQERIEQLGVQLGKPDVVENGFLRQIEGRCVFLEGRLCQIHAEAGAEQKPMICRQYPLLKIRVGGELREGIDPGCYQHFKSWKGAEVDRSEERLVLPRPGASPDEAVVLGLLVGGVGLALQKLISEAPVKGIPPRFAARLQGRLKTMPWERLLNSPDAGPVLRVSLLPVAEWSGQDGLGVWQVGEEEEAFMLDVVQRAVRLQLYGEAIPGPFPAALLTLCGALAAGLAAPREPGPVLAGWTRALRAPAFRAAFIPNVRSLQELL